MFVELWPYEYQMVTKTHLPSNLCDSSDSSVSNNSCDSCDSCDSSDSNDTSDSCDRSDCSDSSDSSDSSDQKNLFAAKKNNFFFTFFSHFVRIFLSTKI